jgi:chromosome segregation ATPase
MTDLAVKIIGPLVAALAGILGGSGGVIWYMNQRASEEHKAQQAEIDRTIKRIERLEQVNAELREDLEDLRGELRDQHDKIIAQGETISTLRQELAEAEREKAAKDGEITRLRSEIDALETRLDRIEEASQPEIVDE